jgi:hypothetical protein
MQKHCSDCLAVLIVVTRHDGFWRVELDFVGGLAVDWHPGQSANTITCTCCRRERWVLHLNRHLYTRIVLFRKQIDWMLLLRLCVTLFYYARSGGFACLGL